MTLYWATPTTKILLEAHSMGRITGMRTFLWTGYAASPRLLRYCIGLIQPSFSFGRSSV